jgi:hypothetical protein
MKGPVYDYQRQRWSAIDTDTDEAVPEQGEHVYRTRDGTLYEVHPSAPMYKSYSPRTPGQKARAEK